MKHAALIIVSLIMVLASASPSPAATKVFLLAGQSNMDGRAPVADLDPPYNQTQTGVKIWNYWGGGGWASLKGGFNTLSYGSYFGPEVSFGHELNALFPDDDIYLVKYAKGGTSLAVDWNPDGTGAYYNAMKSTANAALQNLAAAGLSPEVAGMIWMQGERDAQYEDMAAAYEANMLELIETARDDYSAPDMPFVIGRITTHFGDYNDQVRAAQAAVAEEMENVAWIDTDDLPLLIDNPGHYDADSQIALGARYAGAITELPEPSTLAILAVGLLCLAARALKHIKD